MSGPKIIIVRSAEELKREREQILRQLERLTKEWHETLKSLGELSDEKIAAMEQRSKQLENAFANTHEIGMDKITREINFLKTEIERAQAEAILQLAKRKQRRRSLESTAEAILNDSKQLSESSQKKLRRIKQQANSASEAELIMLDKELSNIVNGLLQVAEPSPDYKTDTELIQNLSKGLAEPTPYSPAYVVASAQIPEKENKLDLLLAEMELTEGESAAAPFVERANTAEATPEASRRQLLIDSLLIDLSKRCRERKERENALKVLIPLKAELALLADSSCESLATRLEEASQTPELKMAQSLEKEVRDCIKTAASKKDAAEKRKAILAGFASMGYDVREGMATGWAKDGRIVVSKKSSPELGIEIGSTEAVERVQVRVVGLVKDGESRDTSKDKEIETEWCSELAQIRAALKSAGHYSEIETALAAGTTAIKTSKPKVWTEDENTEELQEIKEAKQQYRSL